MREIFLALALSLSSSSAIAAIDAKASVAFAPVPQDHAPGSCHVRTTISGLHLPDPVCTPGAVNPTLTRDVLLSSTFRTGLVRDKATSADEKKKVYSWYGIKEPSNNAGQTQVCELDHLIDLGLGGADTLANIWPQCQAANAPVVPVGQREFKTKDRFAEHNAISLLKSGADLSLLQHRIALDWTLLIPKGK
jgi:hypothetical protein